MFSGIITAVCRIENLQEQKNLRSFSIALPKEQLAGLVIGASVSVDGVCLTVVRVEQSLVYFQAVKETLQVTTLGTIKNGDPVNVERSIRVGDEIGGHRVSGHVFGQAEIINIERTGDGDCRMTVKVPQAAVKYIFYKGFVALNGASLTVAEVDKKNATLSICLIPETINKTTFGTKKVGDRINLEIDAQTQSIVDTVQAYLDQQQWDH